MSNKKTLVIISPGFASSETDTNCLPLQQNFILNLKENDPDLHIIVIAMQYPYCKKIFLWHGITVISFNGRNKGGITKLLLRQKVCRQLKNIYNTNKLAGILSFWCGECALIGKRFADKYDLKHYCWILGQDAKKTNIYLNQIKPKPEELVALSDFLQNEFEKNHKIKPLRVIPPGIDTRLFNHCTEEKSIDVLAVGSLIPLKQYNIFIEVIAEVKKDFPHLKVGLVGKGSEKENLQNLIDKYNLSSTITMTGELLHTEVLELMQKTKLFLHPSSYEGFSGVCQEALFAGAQVISFTKPMNREIRNWHIVKHKEEMQKKTMELLNASLLYEKVNTFPIETTAKKIKELFL